MKRIKLTQNQYTLVDDEDYDKLSKYKWYAKYSKCVDGYYVVRNIRKVSGKQRQSTIRMHRVIMNAPKGIQVDHKNHDTLNNQKSNLRLCTNSQNQHNRLPQKNGTSKYKGVCWYKRDKKWYSEIHINYKTIFLGVFDNEKSAALAYDRKAKQLFGEYAYLNFKKRGIDKWL